MFEDISRILSPHLSGGNCDISPPEYILIRCILNETICPQNKISPWNLPIQMEHYGHLSVNQMKVFTEG